MLGQRQCAASQLPDLQLQDSARLGSQLSKRLRKIFGCQEKQKQQRKPQQQPAAVPKYPDARSPRRRHP
uniref:Uncharacterized protein n=1 Tax=Macrostomum lignano TaxID=282301 RepID=A0A1I8FMM4_9PLAT